MLSLDVGLLDLVDDGSWDVVDDGLGDFINDGSWDVVDDGVLEVVVDSLVDGVVLCSSGLNVSWNLDFLLNVAEDGLGTFLVLVGGDWDVLDMGVVANLLEG